ncbi:MAG: 4Fe-4S dicluster domain-containing protein [Clostridia bacterium]|nr:[Fe-Fe] hydrogenase large subunit C-terminal domain-containing protein [Candidatus Pelethousia sp.]NCB31423.1 4Fe-4S dicluster domain-containing protein [Clostridia bacterium]
MSSQELYHSVKLERDKCVGCTTCLKRCPMECIRVRNGKANILYDLCIDCGVCVQNCPHQAKVAQTDPINAIYRFKHRIALPAPALYGQFRNLPSVDNVLNALLGLGFSDVFEVARAADIVSATVRKILKTNQCRPLISSACPAVVALIRIRFPELLPNVADVLSPKELAARMAKEEYSKAHGVPIEEIGAFFITPCPAKMASIHSGRKTMVDGAIAIQDIYGLLSSQLKQEVPESVRRRRHATWQGINWANYGGEGAALDCNNILSVDGIHNVIHVLEEIENGRLDDLDFFEGASCEGGCVGGPLVFENAFVAKNSLRKLIERMRTEEVDHPMPPVEPRDDIRLSAPLEPRPAIKLSDNISEAIAKMERIEALTKTFKGLDCGSCGSPTCRTLAEDIVQGRANEMDCVFKLKEKVEELARQMVDLTNL